MMIWVFIAVLGSVILVAAVLLCARVFSSQTATMRMPLVMCGLAFIALSVGLYYWHGAAPELITQYHTKQQIAQRGGEVMMREAISELEGKVVNDPNQKVFLAQLYEATGELTKARSLYLEIGTASNNSQALVKYLQIEYTLTGALSTEAATVAEALFVQEPNNRLVMSLWAAHLQQQQKYFDAAQIWYRLLFLVQSEEEQQYVIRALEDATALLNQAEQMRLAEWQQNQVQISVAVSLSDVAQAEVRTSDTVFVSIKSPNQAQPLAARRINSAQFPVRLMLTVADLLPPATEFANQLIIKARISANGRPLGDSVVSAEQMLDISNNRQPQVHLQLEVVQ